MVLMATFNFSYFVSVALAKVIKEENWLLQQVNKSNFGTKKRTEDPKK